MNCKDTQTVDPHLGVADGKIMRLHIPIITNPNMEFTSWDMYGRKHTVNMKEVSYGILIFVNLTLQSIMVNKQEYI